MAIDRKVTQAQFLDLVRIVRTAVILDTALEFLEELAPKGHPLYDLWQVYVDQNLDAAKHLEACIAAGEAPDWLAADHHNPDETSSHQ